MKNLNYSELSQDAQIEAFRQVMDLNQIKERTQTMSDLLDNYEFNSFGEIMQDPPAEVPDTLFNYQDGDDGNNYGEGY